MNTVHYIPVACRFKALTPQSVWMTYGPDQREFNIPRSLIHPEDRTMITTLLPGTAMTLRVANWKARELGLETVRDAAAAARDLFDGEEA